jgi:hypothetical protein
MISNVAVLVTIGAKGVAKLNVKLHNMAQAN